MNIDITDIASEQITKVLESKDTKKPLRIYVASFGWAGPTLGLALDEQKEGDISLESNGFDFIIEEGLADMYKSFEIDYSDSWLRRGFTVIADNQRGGC